MLTLAQVVASANGDPYNLAEHIGVLFVVIGLLASLFAGAVALAGRLFSSAQAARFEALGEKISSLAQTVVERGEQDAREHSEFRDALSRHEREIAQLQGATFSRRWLDSGAGGVERGEESG